MSAANPTEGGLCGAKKKSGGTCRLVAGHGTSHVGVGRCRRHGGASPKAEMAGVVTLARREATVMGQPLDIEPGEALLECVRISAGEVQYASDRIAELDPEQIVGPVVSTRPLKREKGAESSTKRVEEHAGPALHIWILVRQQSMDRLVNYSRIALAAGIEERRVRVAESQAQTFAEAMRRLAVALGFDPADPKVREAMRGSLTLIQGGQAA